MANIKPFDIRFLEEIFSKHRGRGYVLNFSDCTFAEFFDAELGVDIDDPDRFRADSTKKQSFVVDLPTQRRSTSESRHKRNSRIFCASPAAALNNSSPQVVDEHFPVEFSSAFKSEPTGRFPHPHAERLQVDAFRVGVDAQAFVETARPDTLVCRESYAVTHHSML
jgi:hypothetical protein